MYMNACNVLLLTSKHEGSPTVVKEALACNLPIVSVDVGDVRQQFAGVPGCVISDNDSPQCIAQALIEVLQYPREISGRERMLTLDEQLVARRVIAVYERAIQAVLATKRRVSFAKSVIDINSNESSISGGH
jgi:glycosyltransferase involved in cell wall biosynthesis